MWWKLLGWYPTVFWSVIVQEQDIFFFELSSLSTLGLYYTVMTEVIMRKYDMDKAHIVHTYESPREMWVTAILADLTLNKPIKSHTKIITQHY